MSGVAEEVGLLWTVTSNGLVVDAVLAHVEPAFPGALQRVFNLQRHAADAVDQDLHGFTVLNRSETFVVGAAADDVAAPQRQRARAPCRRCCSYGGAGHRSRTGPTGRWGRESRRRWRCTGRWAETCRRACRARCRGPTSSDLRLVP